MLKPDLTKWNQDIRAIYDLSYRADHPRTRERFSLLHAILAQGISATAAADDIGRNPHTAMDWVKTYNQWGPEALTFRRTGGRPPLFRKSKGSGSKAS